MSARKNINQENEVGYAIKYFRKKMFPMQGGQAEFAHVLGVTRQEVSAWENGKRNPNLKNLRKIAKTLCVSVNDLTHFQEQNDDAADDSDLEYWKDLAISYKARIKELEAQLKSFTRKKR